jgi:hypothetical protein
MPTARSPRVLTSVTCPHGAKRATGWSGATRSSAARRSAVSPMTRMPRSPRSHVPLGVRRASADSESRSAAGSGPATKSPRAPTIGPIGAANARCVCASLMPGITTRPPRSTRRVARPASRCTSAVVPTVRMRSPRIATASAHGRAESAVKTLPPVRMSVGAGRCARRWERRRAACTWRRARGRAGRGAASNLWRTGQLRTQRSATRLALSRRCVTRTPPSGAGQPGPSQSRSAARISIARKCSARFS